MYQNRRFPYLVLGFLLCVFVSPLLVDECSGKESRGTWKAGTAAIGITPQEPIWLAGYAARTRPSEGVANPIFAKALALQDPAGNKLVVITSDLLGFTKALSDPIAATLAKKFKLRRGQVLFTSSHTHAAPVVREYMVFMYGLSPDQEAAINRYSQELEIKVVQVVADALHRMVPVRLSFGRGSAGFGVNRRLATEKGFVINVNPAGPVDHEVPVLRVDGLDGKLRAILFSYACHNTTLGGDFYRVSGDYAGYAQAALEKDHPGARALFVLGSAGDTNPSPRGKLELAEQHGLALAAAVDEVLRRPMAHVEGRLAAVFDTVALPFAPPPSKEELEARLQEKDVARQRHARRMLDTLSRQGKLPTEYPYPIQVARFGDSLTLVALGGEVVVDYSIRLKRELSSSPLLLVAYANDVMSYIPSVRVLKEGGYEASSSMIYYGRPGPWSEEVEEIVVKKVHDLVRAVSAPARNR